MKATSNIRQRSIIKAIKGTKIAPFIVNEVKDTLKHLNDFKLDNILTNLPVLKKFLKDLDNRNSQMYKTNPKRGKTSEKNITPHDLYISDTGWTSLTKKERNAYTKISTNEKAQKSTIIKGLFLLSLCDFAQGTLCRLENKYYYKVDGAYITSKHQK